MFPKNPAHLRQGSGGHPAGRTAAFQHAGVIFLTPHLEQWASTGDGRQAFCDYSWLGFIGLLFFVTTLPASMVPVFLKIYNPLENIIL